MNSLVASSNQNPIDLLQRSNNILRSISLFKLTINIANRAQSYNPLASHYNPLFSYQSQDAQVGINLEIYEDDGKTIKHQMNTTKQATQASLASGIIIEGSTSIDQTSTEKMNEDSNLHNPNLQQQQQFIQQKLNLNSKITNPLFGSFINLFDVSLKLNKDLKSYQEQEEQDNEESKKQNNKQDSLLNVQHSQQLLIIQRLQEQLQQYQKSLQESQLMLIAQQQQQPQNFPQNISNIGGTSLQSQLQRTLIGIQSKQNCLNLGNQSLSNQNLTAQSQNNQLPQPQNTQMNNESRNINNNSIFNNFSNTPSNKNSANQETSGILSQLNQFQPQQLQQLQQQQFSNQNSQNNFYFEKLSMIGQNDGQRLASNQSFQSFGQLGINDKNINDDNIETAGGGGIGTDYKF